MSDCAAVRPCGAVRPKVQLEIQPLELTLNRISLHKERDIQSDRAQNDHNYDRQNGHAQSWVVIMHAPFNSQAICAAING